MLHSSRLPSQAIHRVMDKQHKAIIDRAIKRKLNWFPGQFHMTENWDVKCNMKIAKAFLNPQSKGKCRIHDRESRQCPCRFCVKCCRLDRLRLACLSSNVFHLAYSAAQVDCISPDLAFFACGCRKSN